MSVREGEVWVAGLSRQTAKDLLARAKEAGLPATVVRVEDGGFVVPEALVKPAPKKKPAAKRSARSAKSKE